MGNIFKIRDLKCMPEWLFLLVYILAVFFLALVLYFSPISLNQQITLIGYSNEKIFSVMGIIILFVLLLKTEKGIIRRFVSFDFFKVAWFSAGVLIIFPVLYFISELVWGAPVHLPSVLFLFSLVFLIFRIVTSFFNDDVVEHCS